MLSIGFLSTCRTPIHVTLQIKDHNFFFIFLYLQGYMDRSPAGTKEAYIQHLYTFHHFILLQMI